MEMPNLVVKDFEIKKIIYYYYLLFHAQGYIAFLLIQQNASLSAFLDRMTELTFIKYYKDKTLLNSGINS